MSEQLKSLLIIIVVLFILFILWAISIGVTYWDVVSRRKLSGIEMTAWIALVVLIPGIGFAAYVFARLLGSFLSPGGPPVENPKRGTILKRQFEPERQTGTISAAEFLPSTSQEVLLTPKTLAVLESKKRMYKLSVITGPHAGVEYILDKLPVTIGRGSDVSIPLDEDQGISRKHAEIYAQTGVLRIRDLKSTHGTKVNDLNINDKSLDPGDRIRVGVSILMVGIQEEQI